MSDKEKMVINIPVRKPGDFEEYNESDRDSVVEENKEDEEFEESEENGEQMEIVDNPEDNEENFINHERSRQEANQKAEAEVSKAKERVSRNDLFKESMPRFAIGHKLSKLFYFY